MTLYVLKKPAITSTTVTRNYVICTCAERCEGLRAVCGITSSFIGVHILQRPSLSHSAGLSICPSLFRPLLFCSVYLLDVLSPHGDCILIHLLIFLIEFSRTAAASKSTREIGHHRQRYARYGTWRQRPEVKNHTNDNNGNTVKT